MQMDLSLQNVKMQPQLRVKPFPRKAIDLKVGQWEKSQKELLWEKDKGQWFISTQKF